MLTSFDLATILNLYFVDKLSYQLVWKVEARYLSVTTTSLSFLESSLCKGDKLICLTKILQDDLPKSQWNSGPIANHVCLSLICKISL